MCGISGLELVIILVVALLVLGPEKLPEMMRFLGGVMREVRRVSGEVGRIRSDLTQSSEVEELKRQLRSELSQDRQRGGRASVESEIDAIRAKRATTAPEGAVAAGVQVAGTVPREAEGDPGAAVPSPAAPVVPDGGNSATSEAKP